jgi:hypothetical protein
MTLFAIRDKTGEAPCGECHLQPGETCDICGASQPASERRVLRCFQPVDFYDQNQFLMDADTLRLMVTSRFTHYPENSPPMAEIARELGLHPEVVQSALSGRREPAKTFLDASGYERVSLYRRKASQ